MLSKKIKSKRSGETGGDGDDGIVKKGRREEVIFP